jgi:hypothetical protein
MRVYTGCAPGNLPPICWLGTLIDCMVTLLSISVSNQHRGGDVSRVGRLILYFIRIARASEREANDSTGCSVWKGQLELTMGATQKSGGRPIVLRTLKFGVRPVAPRTLKSGFRHMRASAR